MDFELGERAERMRAEVRAFLAEHYDDAERERQRLSGDGHDPELHRRLAERGWVAAAWPEEVGGQGRDPYEMLALIWELSKAEFPWFGLLNNSFVGQTLLEFGSQEHRSVVVPALVSGDAVVALGYSEPSAGSDVAAARTTARRDGDDWVIDGQKMFTTLAHVSQYIFTLTRTNSEKAKHRGLTMFLVPTDSPGIEIQAVATLGGERTNIVFFNDVRVPDSTRVGDIDGGWAVIRYALGIEQSVGYADRMELLLERGEAWARSDPATGARPADDPAIREQLARAAVNAEVAKLLRYRAAWVAAEGRPDAGEGLMAKSFSAQAFVEDATAWMQLLGPSGVLQRGVPGAPEDGAFEETFRDVPVTTIYGGSLEIIRSQIAEHVLGLPRSR